MTRYFLLALVLLLTACQGTGFHLPSTSDSSNSSPAGGAFDSDTGQTYNPQNGEYQQKPPFGDRSNQNQ